MQQSFRTEIKVEPVENQIGLQSSVFSMGSCFADHIVDYFEENKITASSDPFGIAFNPISIAKRIIHSLEGKVFSEDQIVQRDGLYFHYQAHSELYGLSNSDLSKKLSLLHKEVSQKLTSSNFLILTLGTSYAFELTEKQDIVANCHKQNSSLFTKKLLSLDYILSSLSKAIRLAQKFNPKLQTILTVSPIRHTREGLANNSLSKSILRQACHHLTEQENSVTYFPSFEIMMDDLRSYRFYEEDLIHPNKQAKSYIFSQFKTSYFDNALKKHLSDWHKLSQRLKHRPLHPRSPNYFTFLLTLLKDLEKFNPLVNLTEEIRLVKSKIDSFDNLEA